MYTVAHNSSATGSPSSAVLNTEIVVMKMEERFLISGANKRILSFGKMIYGFRFGVLYTRNSMKMSMYSFERFINVYTRMTSFFITA